MMPCKEKKGKQRRLCFATKEFTDFSKIKKQKKNKDKILVFGMPKWDIRGKGIKLKVNK